MNMRPFMNSVYGCCLWEKNKALLLKAVKGMNFVSTWVSYNVVPGRSQDFEYGGVCPIKADL